MKIHCTKCGEELLGAVNRCWNCGTKFVPSSDSSAPPVRKVPAPSDVAEAAGEGPTDADSVDTPHSDESTEAISVEVVVPPEPIASQSIPTRPLGNREKGAVASLFVAGIGFVALLYPPLAIFLGLLGVLLGVIGIDSKSRLLATIGLVLSVLVISAAIMLMVLRLYAWRYGGSPFTPQVQPNIVE